MKLLKHIYHNTRFGKLLITLYYTFKTRFLPEKVYERYTYKKKFGEFPDLKNPKTLNEKIKWLKLHDRTGLHTQCADKYEVRSYISEKIGEQYLVPLYFKTEHALEINAQNLPDTPCIVKTNHDSGGVHIIRDKNQVDWTALQKQLKIRLKYNYYWRSKEWQYKNIRPKIIVEKLLLDEKGNIPEDFKLHFFNGKIGMIQIDTGRGTARHYRFWFTEDWDTLPFTWSPAIVNESDDASMKIPPPPPKNLEKMIRLSRELAQPFRYVRVDWYEVMGELFFGELTFHHDGGNQPIVPRSWDEKLGAMLDLYSTK